MFEEEFNKIPLGRALVWIFLSTLFTSGTALMGWLYYLHARELHSHDAQYRIIAIIQASPQKESLKTAYLAEWLHLSLDKPINLYQFNLQEAEQRLLASPLIKKAAIKKIRPGALYIEYETRTPVAYLGDYTNAALDENGSLFPFSPFFTPKKIPILYLGLDNMDQAWGSSLLEDERLQLAFALLRFMRSKQLNVKQIDVSRAFEDSYGQRQIVVLIDEEKECELKGRTVLVVKPCFLRLNVECFMQNLTNYLTLKQALIKQLMVDSASNEAHGSASKLIVKPTMIDLRIPHLAFITKDLQQLTENKNEDK